MLRTTFPRPLQLRFFYDLDYKASVLAISLGADDSNACNQSCRDMYNFLKMLWQHILSLGSCLCFIEAMSSLFLSR